MQQDLAIGLLKMWDLGGLNQNWRAGSAGGGNRLRVLGNPHMVLTKSTSHQSLWAVHELANKETPSI